MNTESKYVILSEDEKPERTMLPLSAYPTIPDNYSKQSAHYFPKKLFFRDGKLFKINDKGKLIKKNSRGFARKRYVAWYSKVKETKDGAIN